MKNPLYRLDHLELRLLTFTVAAMGVVGALGFWFYPKDLNLSRAKSSTIKNEMGKPAQLLWLVATTDPWRGKQKGDDIYDDMSTSRMRGRGFKVAHIRNRPDGLVKVALVSQSSTRFPTEEDVYVVQRRDLSKNLSLSQAVDDWFNDHLSTD